MRTTWITLAVTAALTLGATAADAGWDEGLAAFKGGNYSQAAKEFQAMAEQRPDWPGGHFMLGQSLTKLNRKDDAVKAFRAAYDLKPDDVQYQMALASAYYKIDRYNEAARLLEAIKESSLPANQRATYTQMLAVSMGKSGRGGQALAAFRNAAQSNPNDSAAQYNYGIQAFNAGETDNAVAAFGKATKLDPSTKNRGHYVNALVRQAAENRNNDAKKLQIYKTAVTEASALAAASGTYENYLTLGEVQLGSKQYAAAVDSFQRAVAKNGSNWLSHYYLSQAQTAVGRYADAERALQASLTKNPGAANEKKIWSQIGFVKEKLKDLPQAKLAYQKAGDTAGVNRIETNQNVAAENDKIEKENDQIEALKAEQERLASELEKLNKPPG